MVERPYITFFGRILVDFVYPYLLPGEHSICFTYQRFLIPARSPIFHTSLHHVSGTVGTAFCRAININHFSGFTACNVLEVLEYLNLIRVSTFCSNAFDPGVCFIWKTLR